MSCIPPSLCRALGSAIRTLCILTMLPVAASVLVRLPNGLLMVAGVLLCVLLGVVFALVPLQSSRHALVTLFVLFILTGMTALALFSIVMDRADLAVGSAYPLSNREAITLCVNMGHTYAGMITFLVPVALLAYLASARFGYWPPVIAGSIGVALGISNAIWLGSVLHDSQMPHSSIGELLVEDIDETLLIMLAYALVSIWYGIFSIVIPAVVARRINTRRSTFVLGGLLAVASSSIAVVLVWLLNSLLGPTR